MESQKQIVDFAISQKELEELGCPVCGYAYGTWGFMGGGGVAVGCGNKSCQATFYVLGDGINVFDGCSFSHKNNKGEYIDIKPSLKPHPRRGIPAWGKREDRRPKKGGEFFTNPKESTYKHGLCFICESSCRLPVDVEWPMKRLFSISIETACVEAAKRICSMFRKAKLWTTQTGDGTQYPMKCYFVNISSCYNHRPNLLKLREVAEKEGVITDKVLRKIKALK